MNQDPESNKEHPDTQDEDGRPNRHGEDPDSPGATIDDPEPAEPNEPG